MRRSRVFWPVVIPAKAGLQELGAVFMDPGFRRATAEASDDR
jgi:hypothetical protein